MASIGRIYKHKEDIDRIEEFSAEHIDKLAFVVLARTDAALADAASLDLASRDTFRKLLDALLATHKTIRMLLLSKCENGRHRPGGISLVREQVEALYTVTLICTDPTKWANLYLRSAWAEQYSELFVETQQMADLPAFQDFISNTGPMLVNRMRIDFGVSEVDRDKLQEQLTAWVAGRGPWPPQSSYWKFPTPGGVIKRIKGDPRRKKHLQSWYQWYSRLCTFAHVRATKLLLYWFEVHKHRLMPDEEEQFKANYYHNAAVVSWLAVGSACTEVFILLDKPPEMAEALEAFWQHFRTFSLFGKELWHTAIAGTL